MTPLATIQQLLTWFCVLRADKDTSRLVKLAYLAFSVSIFFVLFSVFVATMVFFFEYILHDLEQAMYAIATTILVFSAMYTFVIVYYARLKVKNMLDRFKAIYDDCKYFISFMKKKQFNKINDISLEHR